ncbi:anaerobic ribonucleoside-triphosphate reductase activating protein [Konateibacter massiliensis]|uniref:anaerobic ribonucleoside-triphosphate reductase activating protein n=1 Tax=Konateibacter massiliensis TaxID=2002841 RepID=UPI000C1479D6|nr:anaerobic ribonucleoside-triphosphate reductase activating protein [Konateibacter massiliensis]
MNYIKIEKESAISGNGLRVVIWLSSCSHNCPGCQNPQTWNPNSGIVFDQAAHNELFEQLSKDYISGITFTGGDPLHDNNLRGVLDLVNEFHISYPKKNIWLYTGFYWEEIFEPSFTEQSDEEIEKYLQDCEIRKRIISMCDVLVDGRYVDELRDLTLKFRGSSNQRLIDVQQSLKKGEVMLWDT